ncbi:YbhN family protein [candidate division KSB1 bacterium]
MKKNYGILIRLIVTLSVFFYLFNVIDFSSMVKNFSNLENYWVILAIFCMISSNILGTLQWNLILKNLDINLPFRKTVSYYFSGLFFNNFLLSFIGGDVVRVYDISKTSGKNSEAISTVLLDRLIGFIALSTLAMLGFFYAMNQLDLTKFVYFAPGIFIVLSIVLLFLFHKPFAKKFENIGIKLTPKRLQYRIREIYNSINYYSSHPVLLVKLFIIAITIQIARVLTHYFLAVSMGVDINLAYFLLFIPIITLVIALPISFGGIGVRESSAAVLFGTIGVPVEQTTVFEFLAYIIAILCSLPGGIAYVFRKYDVSKKAL